MTVKVRLTEEEENMILSSEEAVSQLFLCKEYRRKMLRI